MLATALGGEGII